MDDFSVYGKSFDDCLSNLDRVLQRCEQTNLVLNWEKCHFNVNEGIVLGHKILERGVEVDKAKVDAIEKMPCPKDMKGIRTCRMWGSGKPLRFEHLGAREVFPSYRSMP